jgi:hypothetical protein
VNFDTALAEPSHVQLRIDVEPDDVCPGVEKRLRRR